jgi:hypothetical protein
VEEHEDLGSRGGEEKAPRGTTGERGRALKKVRSGRMTMGQAIVLLEAPKARSSVRPKSCAQ